jgi:uncharacterized LabA/DUF88 family protein
MGKCVILVDNSNLFIGGRKYSAQQKGVEPEHSESHDVSDPSWRIKYDTLLPRLARGRDVHAAIMVASCPADRDNDPVWASARDVGFEVIVHERAPGRGEKAVDTEIVARGTELIATAEEPMDLVLVSGDKDYVPLVEVAHRHGWKVEICAFTSSYDPGGELAQAVEKVRPLDDIFAQIGYHDFEWPNGSEPRR